MEFFYALDGYPPTGLPYRPINASCRAGHDYPSRQSASRIGSPSPGAVRGLQSPGRSYSLIRGFRRGAARSETEAHLPDVRQRLIQQQLDSLGAIVGEPR